MNIIRSLLKSKKLIISPLFRNQEVVVYGVHVPQNVGKKRIELNMTIISTSDTHKTYPHVFFTL